MASAQWPVAIGHWPLGIGYFRLLSVPCSTNTVIQRSGSDANVSRPAGSRSGGPEKGRRAGRRSGGPGDRAPRRSVTKDSAGLVAGCGPRRSPNRHRGPHRGPHRGGMPRGLRAGVRRAGPPGAGFAGRGGAGSLRPGQRERPFGAAGGPEAGRRPGGRQGRGRRQASSPVVTLPPRPAPRAPRRGPRAGATRVLPGPPCAAGPGRPLCARGGPRRPAHRPACPVTVLKRFASEGPRTASEDDSSPRSGRSQAA
ncbi:hypothetical protein QF030_008150 [Streptomyces rishiriensis]|uniref:Uncharacterized protein n=1 Tax=Streptomyces rishiriensis TaxID=68264 RepID=A0ABU0P548_STRRH|nr:hypothetical protein [Streptomyces rishiriensis]